VVAPVAPMLARLVRELPEGDWFFEPKWHGFRCLAFRTGECVELYSRNPSTPLRWDEVEAGAAGRTALRFDGDLFGPVLELDQHLPAAPPW